MSTAPNQPSPPKRSRTRNTPVPGTAPAEPDQWLATLRYVMDSMAPALGDRVEIVLHDFRRPERSIVAVSGGVTGRKPGGSVTQIGLSIMKAGDQADDQYTYVTSAPSGRILKSITVPLRDSKRHVFGAICVNVDITDLWMMGQSIQALVGGEQEPPKPVTFLDDIDRVIGDVLKEESTLLGRRLSDLSRDERFLFLEALDRRGIFSLQRSIPQVAEQLGLSRATLYNDLKRMRQGKGDNQENQRAHPNGAAVRNSKRDGDDA